MRIPASQPRFQAVSGGGKADLHRLRGLIEDVEAGRAVGKRGETDGAGLGAVSIFFGRGGSDGGDSGRAPTGSALEVGLRRGAVHEWIAAEAHAGVTEATHAGRLERPPWRAPLCLFMHTVRRALEESAGRRVVWIGRRCWVHPPALAASGGPRAPGLASISRFIFLDPPDDASRLWAIDLALRCPAVAVVVADGGGLTMSATRRLQLAAEQGGGLGLLARPACERGALSAAATRWVVAPSASPTRHPRWTVELLRCKGVRPSSGAPRRWVVEWDHAQGVLIVSSDVVDGAGAAPRARAIGAGAGRPVAIGDRRTA